MKSKQTKKEEFRQAAIAKGWKPDSYGHLQHTTGDGRVYRLKLKPLAWRLERRHLIVDHNEWLKVAGAYYGGSEAPATPADKPKCQHCGTYLNKANPERIWTCPKGCCNHA